ncbi:MAG: serine/threonine-protein kinase, partial [Pirellulaceae bacterium]
MSDDRSSHRIPANDEAARSDQLAGGAGSEYPVASPRAGQARTDGQETIISRRPPVSAPKFQQAANPYEMGEALEGERLGHFQLDQFIGGGGMGAVFRATDTMLGRTVAVKVVSRDHANEDAQRRFKNEAQSAARLDHPNIARVYYVGEDKSWNYIVFEYIEGVNVRDLVAHNGPLTLEDAISYALQIAEALEHASERDVTHRDIKPSNILIVVDGRAKLVDMGLARLHHVESTADDLTASGVTLGTFDYISPEQARDPRNTDVRSDLYSLGCTLFFMLTGRPPFPDGTVLQKLLSHSSDTPPELRKYRPELDEDVARIINKLLAKQPEQRFQTPRELIGEVLLMAERLNLSGIGGESAVWLTRSSDQEAWWVRHLPWTAAVFSLLLVVVGYSWVDSSTSAPAPPAPRLAASAAAKRGSSETAPKSPDTTSDETPDEAALPPMSRPRPRTDASPPPMPPPSVRGARVGDTTARAPEKTDRPADGAPDRAPVDTDSEEPTGEPTELEETSEETVAATESGNGPKAQSSTASGDTTSSGGTNGEGADTETEDTGEDGAAKEPEGVDNATAEDAAAPAMETELIVVSEQPLADDAEATAVESLDAALSHAATLDRLAEIELRFDGLRVLRPLSIKTDEIPENRVTSERLLSYHNHLRFHRRGRCVFRLGFVDAFRFFSRRLLSGVVRFRI